MLQIMNPGKVGSNLLHGDACGHHHTDDGSTRLRADFPDMQIGQLQSSHFGQPGADRGGYRCISRIEQHSGSIPDQRHCPARNHIGTNQPHDWIEPAETQVTPGQQSDNCQHRNQGVGQNVDIGGAEIVIVLMTMVVMLM